MKPYLTLLQDKEFFEARMTYVPEDLQKHWISTISNTVKQKNDIKNHYKIRITLPSINFKRQFIYKTFQKMDNCIHLNENEISTSDLASEYQIN